MDKLVEVNNLRVSYDTYQGEVQSVRGASFYIAQGETVALVGESGCGKSVTAKSLLRLIREPGKIKEGSEILFDGKNVLDFTRKELNSFRGEQASIIFQDALASLNPTMRIGNQIMETLRLHRRLSKSEAREEAMRILKEVGIPEPERRIDQYPHEFSGGMRQRIMIGIAFACQPRLLIADEPTTALDVTIQAQIIDLLKSLQEQNHTSILMITHDLGVVASAAKRIYIMYAGTIVEEGTSRQIFYEAQHPYTWALLKAVPRLDGESKSELESIEGAPPDLIAPPVGCPFSTRCKHCMAICRRKTPEATDFGDGHRAKCWLHHPLAQSAKREEGKEPREHG